ncbi:MAG: WD40 repeat domain-containing protein [Planctomycetota bacterium]
MKSTLVAALCVLGLCFQSACVASSVPPPRATLQAVPGDVRGIVFSPDGHRLAVSTGQLVKIWEWESNNGAGKVIQTIQGGLGAAFSSDGTTLALPGQNEAYSDGLVIWGIDDNKKRFFIPDDNVQSPVFTADGKSIAAAVGNRVKVWKLPSCEEGLPMKDGHKCSINAIAFGAGGKTLISGDGKGVLSRWELPETGPVKKGEYKYLTDDVSINSLACSLDGNWVVASTGDGNILLLDAGTLALKAQIKAHKDGLRVKSVAISPDNKTIAAACSGIEDLEIKLFDIDTHKSLAAFIGHQSGVNCVAFSPDGKWLATGSDDKTAKVWDVAALRILNLPKPEKKKEAPKE